MNVADVGAVENIEHLSSPAPWTGDLFRGCLRPDYLCRVVEQDGVVMGFAVANHAAGEGHLLNIAIHPRWRALGHGRRLLATMMALLARRFVTTVFLEVRQSNDRAIDLYERFGFDVIGTRVDYYARGDGREDALTMRCALENRDTVDGEGR